MSNEYTIELMHAGISDKVLMHYGVMGMKWGVRRYQPYSQGYNSEAGGRFVGDKKAYKAEYKKDKKEVDSVVRRASILGAAREAATKRDLKAMAKVVDLQKKDPYSKKLGKHRMALEASGNARATMEREYKEAAAKAEKLVSDLQKKYGKEKVRDLKYSTDKYGNRVINERVVSGKEVAQSALTIIGGVAAGILGAPVIVYQVPRSRKDMGARTANDAFINEWSALKQAQKQAGNAK